jgi:hypothetical protein
LFHEHLFIENTMEKSIGDVQLVNWPIMMYGKCKNKSKNGRFDDWAEGLKVVNSTLLIKTFGNYPSFEAFNASIRMLLDLINSFVTNNILVQRTRAKSPGLISKESIKFSSHGYPPVMKLNGLRETSGFRWNGDSTEGFERMLGRIV